MLKSINLKNIAIAHDIEINFGAGFNVITGETGTGKSLLVDALSLIKSVKFDSSLIRYGCEEALIGACFEFYKNCKIKNLLKKNGFLLEDIDTNELFIRRIIHQNGRSKNYINDVLVSAKFLVAVTTELIDISSQFENQKLLDVTTHAYYLDKFCNIANLTDTIIKNYDKINFLLKQLVNKKEEKEIKQRENDLLEFELNEINKADISNEDYKHIENILNIGKKTEFINKLCSEINIILLDNENSILSHLIMIKKNTDKLSKFIDAEEYNILNNIKGDLNLNLDLFANTIQQIQKKFEINPQEHKHALERIEIYNKLFNKFGSSCDAILRHKEKCKLFLSIATNLEEEINKIIKDIRILIMETILLAEKVSEVRKIFIKKLSESIENELATLGMPKAKFICELTDNQENKIILPKELFENFDNIIKYKFISKSGFENVRFLLNANEGSKPAPIEKVASGGELSRIMLAIKSILYDDASVSLFVFDEIDTGISGAIGAKVGKKMKQFSLRHQSLCITHLPQIACFASTHYVAEKYIKDGQTFAQIVVLDNEGREHELAKMLSGEKITEESKAHARRLLQEYLL